MPVVDPNWAREAGKYQMLMAPDPEKHPITSKKLYICAAVLVAVIALVYLVLSGLLLPKEPPNTFFYYGDTAYIYGSVQVPELPEGFVLAGYAALEEQEDGTQIGTVREERLSIFDDWAFYANPDVPKKAYLRLSSKIDGSFQLLKRFDD